MSVLPEVGTSRGSVSEEEAHPTCEDNLQAPDTDCQDH